jgi:hypothetical protein
MRGKNKLKSENCKSMYIENEMEKCLPKLGCNIEIGAKNHVK